MKNMINRMVTVLVCLLALCVASPVSASERTLYFSKSKDHELKITRERNIEEVVLSRAPKENKVETTSKPVKKSVKYIINLNDLTLEQTITTTKVNIENKSVRGGRKMMIISTTTKAVKTTSSIPLVEEGFDVF